MTLTERPTILIPSVIKPARNEQVTGDGLNRNVPARCSMSDDIGKPDRLRS